MTDNVQKKTNPAIIRQLSSGVEEQLLSAITGLRETGNQLYMPDLLRLLRDSAFEAVKQEIRKLFIDLKDKNAVPYLIDAIADSEYASIRKDLLSCCWQSGFDFAGYLSFFVDQVILNDWEVAFEAFTVIENLETFPSHDILENEIKKINRVLPSSEGNKKYLLTELRSILA